MTYDFDLIIPRRHTNSVKWDEASQEEVIPLWVADMDFPVYPAITEALRRRVDHGIFGYTHIPQTYYDSVIRWFCERHGVKPFTSDDIIVTTGVVPAISAIIRALTLPGDKVLVMSPVYNCFFSSIRNQGCQVEASPLRYDEAPPQSLNGQDSSHQEEGRGTFNIDWEDFERRCADPRVRVFLFCNPHNPVGRVWTRDEVTRIYDICRRHDVFIIADEIHCEIVMPGTSYVSLGSVAPSGDGYVLCLAPTKAFNIAGLQIANIVATDPKVRERIDRVINLHEVCDVNPFGVVATEAAYTDGGWEWLQQLNAYIAGNYRLLCRFVNQHMPMLRVVRLEGTYLAWVDCEALGLSSPELVDHLLQHHRVWLNDGEMYGEQRRAFVRINLACPRAILEEGLQRMADGVQSLCLDKL